MAYTHPIGDDHPFPKVHALAQAEGYEPLEMVNVYDGALIRLYCSATNMVFKLAMDPGSAMDRQRFDYYEHIRLDPNAPSTLLDQIKSHITRGKSPKHQPAQIGKGRPA